MTPEEDADERVDQLEGTLEIIEALVLAAEHRDEVFRAISTSVGVDDAAEALQQFLRIDEAPARAILNAQLRQFTSLERGRLTERRDQIKTELDRLRAP